MKKWLLTNECLRKYYFGRSEIERILILSCLFSGLLLFARIIVTRSAFYLFLPWNLLLAFIPYRISAWLSQRPAWIQSKYKFAIIFLAWLFFIPNAFYIITDLFHLGKKSPNWFDLTLIFSFAWNGLLLGLLSFRQMEKISRYWIRSNNEFIFLLPVMWLIALGVFIGRYLRFNSWDVITNPLGLGREIADLFIDPFGYRQAWAMIACFSVFMTLVYMTVKRISKMAW